jgi:hypothetical protein
MTKSMKRTLKTTHSSALSKLLPGILVFSFFLCSCASPLLSSSNRYFPVQNRDLRANSLGFSISPPSGSGWYEKLNDKSLYYLKKIQRDDYSIYTKATEIHLENSELGFENFLQFVKNNKKIDTTSGHYRNVSLRITANKELSPLCVRYFQDYEDHGTKHVNKDEFIRVQKNGLLCMHPETPENGVDMFYAESFRQSLPRRDQSFRDEGEFFLSSLKFHSSGG